MVVGEKTWTSNSAKAGEGRRDRGKEGEDGKMGIKTRGEGSGVRRGVEQVAAERRDSMANLPSKQSPRLKNDRKSEDVFKAFCKPIQKKGSYRIRKIFHKN